jgi:transposase
MIMAVADSMDLRLHIQQELAKKTLCMRELAEKYSISISTLHLWRRLLAHNGTLQPKKEPIAAEDLNFSMLKRFYLVLKTILTKAS